MWKVVALTALSAPCAAVPLNLRHAQGEPAPPFAFTDGQRAVSFFNLREAAGDEVVKGEYDARLYRQYTMKNGLHCILISDPETEMAAAAMNVGSGHFNDPKEISGLAHFLEHMLFLGTSKYPAEDSYDTFLDEHGGQFNAYTSTENTNFFFGIPPTSFKETLDHFAQFFVEPLFSINATRREMNAVDSEHQKNVEDDSWRMYRLAEQLASTECPVSKFGTGNLETLGIWKDEVLHSRLEEMWGKYFVARNLRLVVLGAEGLDELQGYVEDLFKDVPDKPYTAPDYKCNHTNVYPTELMGSKTFYSPVRERNLLSIVFPIKPQMLNYQSKSVGFISSLLSNEDKGGLTDVLKNQGWVTTAGPSALSEDTSIHSLFGWSFELTEAGLAQQDDILQAFFSYLSLVKKKGVERWRYKEMSDLSDIDFKFKSKEPAMDFVSTVAQGFGVYPASDVLTADALYVKFDPEEIASVLDALAPDNMLTFLVSKTTDEKELDLEEPWYKFKYGVKSMPSKTLELFLDAKPSFEHQFELPQRNSFIPADLSMRAAESESNSVSLLAQTPDILQESVEPSMRLWHHQDTHFKLPKTSFQVRLWTPVPHSSPHAYVLTNLYVNLVEDMLSERTGQAALASLYYEVGIGFRGLDIQVGGYSDQKQLAKYVDLIFSQLGAKEQEFLEQRFEDIRMDMFKTLRNSGFGRPSDYARGVMETVLFPNTDFHPSILAAALRHIELKDVVSFRKTLFSDLRVEALCFGNVLREEAAALLQSAVNNMPYSTESATFGPRSHVPVTLPRARLVKLPAGTRTTVETLLPNVKDKNSVVMNYYQFGPATPNEELYSALLDLVAAKPLYNQLRTIEQLGYIVWSYRAVKSHVDGFSVLVQSAQYNASYVASRIDSAVEDLRKVVYKLAPLEDDAEADASPLTLTAADVSNEELEDSAPDFGYRSSLLEKEKEAPEKEEAAKKEEEAPQEESLQTYIDSLYQLSTQEFTTMQEQGGHFWDRIEGQDLDFGRKIRLAQLLKDPKEVNATGFRAFFDKLMGGEEAGMLSVRVSPQAAKEEEAKGKAEEAKGKAEGEAEEEKPKKEEDIVEEDGTLPLFLTRSEAASRHSVYRRVAADPASSEAAKDPASVLDTSGPADLEVVVTDQGSGKVTRMTMSTVAAWTDDLPLWPLQPPAELPDVLPEPTKQEKQEKQEAPAKKSDA